METEERICTVCEKIVPFSDPRIQGVCPECFVEKESNVNGAKLDRINAITLLKIARCLELIERNQRNARQS